VPASAREEVRQQDVRRVTLFEAVVLERLAPASRLSVRVHFFLELLARQVAEHSPLAVRTSEQQLLRGSSRGEPNQGCTCTAAIWRAHGSAWFRSAGSSKNGWWVQFDSAGGAAGRRDFEDPVLGPNPGPHFEPTALYPTVGCRAVGPRLWAGFWAQNPVPEIRPARGGASRFLCPRVPKERRHRSQQCLFNWQLAAEAQSMTSRTLCRQQPANNDGAVYAKTTPGSMLQKTSHRHRACHTSQQAPRPQLVR